MECLLRGRLSQDTAVARLNEENLGLINLPGWVCAATGAADHLTLHLSFLQPVKKKKKKLWIFLFFTLFSAEWSSSSKVEQRCSSDGLSV